PSSTVTSQPSRRSSRAVRIPVIPPPRTTACLSRGAAMTPPSGAPLNPTRGLATIREPRVTGVDHPKGELMSSQVDTATTVRSRTRVATGEGAHLTPAPRLSEDDLRHAYRVGLRSRIAEEHIVRL